MTLKRNNKVEKPPLRAGFWSLPWLAVQLCMSPGRQPFNLLQGKEESDVLHMNHDERHSNLTLWTLNLTHRSIAWGAAMLLLGCASAQAAGSWTYRDGIGKNEALCHDLLKRLNRYDSDESLDRRCSLSVISCYPKFTAPPWEELDLRKYEDLFFELTKYSGEGHARYFHLQPVQKQQKPDSYYRYRAKLFIEEGGRLRMWRTRLVNNYGTGPILSAPSGDQTIVQMYIPSKSQDKYCSINPANANSVALLFIVTPDLKGPDPNIDPGTHGILGGRDLMIYEGKPILIGSEDIWRDGTLMLEQICDFEFVKGKK